MPTRDGLKDLYERKARAMIRRPSFALGRGNARIRTDAALGCRVDDEGDRTLVVDLPAQDGGTGAGLHPGHLMRASIGAGMVIGYRLWAARLDVPIDDVDLELVCEYDARGEMGLAPGPEIAIGWQRITFNLTVTSRQPEAEIRRLVETANRLNPMLANLSPAIKRIHRLMIIRPPQP
jgi:uncharacterized OsmC-like protein